MSAESTSIYGLTPEAPEPPEDDPYRKHYAEFYRRSVNPLLADARFLKALNAIRQQQRSELHRARAGHSKFLGPFVLSIQEQGQDPAEFLGKLLDMAPLLTAIAVTKNLSARSRENFWAVGTGKTWKSLKELPRRLRSMADEIQRLNDSPLFAPEQAISSKAPTAQYARQQFARLPALLRIYARWLEVWISKIPGFMAQQFPPRRGRAETVVALSQLVKIASGSYCDEEVSELLSAADAFLNPSDKRRDGFDARVLATMRYRLKVEKKS